MSIDAITRREDALPPAVRGRVANDPAHALDDLYVVIPTFSARQRWGPCYRTDTGAQQPERGDTCLVVFDEHGDPWVIAWWKGTDL